MREVLLSEGKGGGGQCRDQIRLCIYIYTK